MKLTLDEIRQRYQIPHYEAKKIDYWVSRNIYSRLATPLTWLFLKTSITANQITVLWVMLGIFSCSLFAFGKYWLSIIGCLLIQLHILLDYVDGPVARAKNLFYNNPIKGVYIERIGHDLVYTIYFYCLSMGALKRGFNHSFMLTLGFLASVGYFFYKYTRRAKIYCVLVYDKNKGYSSPQETIQKIKSNPSLIRILYRKTQILWDPIAFTFITLILAIFNLIHLVPIFYGLTYPWLFFLSYVYQAKIGNDWVYQWLKNLK